MEDNMQYKKKIFDIVYKEIKLTPKVVSFADESNETSILFCIFYIFFGFICKGVFC